jgi:hypothetical protein
MQADAKEYEAEAQSPQRVAYQRTGGKRRVFSVKGTQKQREPDPDEKMKVETRHRQGHQDTGSYP